MSTHDFAKIRPEPVLEKKPAENPPAWSLMITGMVLGITIGVFACVLLYLSGNVPPIAEATIAQGPIASAESLTAEPVAEEEPALEFEFYEELQRSEVIVDATPVDLSSQDPERLLDTPYMLQTGAFERRAQAETEMNRQAGLGLTVVVKEQALVGRTLYLVQAGPYTTNGGIDNAETVLRRNNIPSFRAAIR